ncbi:hypothetical protein [Ochrobactrum chromiisoli]|uniref:TNase-like domain-containing protein n=1 Tax=Ochrobactrum chromiisoli TaxID=2993941 RepID=A0ABT3QP98_9HYPH|nr:hypothetical protein [Ochrobactrum chromiisoli]MCX2697385.1 hypothetical protein [Ochrobactrum chromiisoli]
MSIKKTILLLLVFLCFISFVLYLLAEQRKIARSNINDTQSTDPIHLSGQLNINSLSDLRVSGRKIALCGVSFTKPRQFEDLMLAGARRSLQGSEVKCTQVGGGTPCDGNSATRFGEVIVVQCLTSDKRDVARILSEEGIFCDLPAQSGGYYRPC